MNKEEAGKTHDGEEIPDPVFEINTRIAKELGLRLEAQDGIVKAWSQDETPTEDNWFTLPDFVSDPCTNAEMLEELGYQLDTKEQPNGLWICTIAKRSHVQTTPAHITEALAIADGYLIALQSKSVVT